LFAEFYRIDVNDNDNDNVIFVEEERLVEMQKEFPDAHRGDLLRFLRARQLSTKDGAAMFRKWLKVNFFSLYIYFLKGNLSILPLVERGIQTRRVR